MTNIADAAANEIKRAMELAKAKFPGDSDEQIDRLMREAFVNLNANPQAVINAEALLAEYEKLRR